MESYTTTKCGIPPPLRNERSDKLLRTANKTGWSLEDTRCFTEPVEVHERYLTFPVRVNVPLCGKHRVSTPVL